MTSTDQKYEGTCAVCEGRYRTQQKNGKWAMVHHGYRRPGDGVIHGDCFAVGREPYEISCDATRDYRAEMTNLLESIQRSLDRLRTGQTTELWHEFTLTIQGPSLRSEHWLRVVREARLLRVTSQEVTPEWQQLWQQAVEDTISATELRIKFCRGEIDRCNRLIDAWQPRELTPVEPKPKREAPSRRRRRRIGGW